MHSKLILTLGLLKQSKIKLMMGKTKGKLQNGQLKT